MNNLVSNKRTGSLLLVALVVVILGAIYYFVIYPLSEEKNSKEVIVSNVRNEVAVLQEQLTTPEVEEEPEEHTFTLKKKVPLTRELDKLIRSIEEIELISESKIVSVNFNNYDEVVAESPLVPTQTQEETNEENTQTTDIADLTDTTTETETPVSPVANIILPPQLKLITFNISVLTKDYDHFMQFMEELEKTERIVRVDQLSFSLPGEEQFYVMDSVDAILAEIQVTTFYYDGE
ncbi:potassium transporter [Psychrobacillus soli]|uniref:Potassium transporter n=1 Tax=Psychrobacillus soli TaxID=1543965 RepID=A0A544TBL0_9BACI|nr:potassium transporter [Psychrobacillus soli]TQR14833.1 potassium transporter [Psychrobacillus soli]